jgi:hypothetical protein
MVQIRDLYRMIWPVYTGYPLIRIGGNCDGSYLVPDAISGIELCCSPGTSGFIEFELHLGEAYSIPILLCDPNEDSPLNLPEYMKFDRASLAGSSGKLQFTFSDWLARHGFQKSGPLLLSMDIEGAEIEVISSISDAELAQIRIATIEFHYFHLFHVKEGLSYFEAVYSVLHRLAKFFDVVHMKPNNNCPFCVKLDGISRNLYTCVELTFLNKIMRRSAPRHVSPCQLPHRLDQPNVLTKPEADYTLYRDLALTETVQFN